MVSRFEKARIVGARAIQIAMGAPVNVNLTKEELEKINYDVVEIALKEFNNGKIPIKVKEGP